MLLFLADLQARQMRVLQHQLVFFTKVVCHGALHCLPGVQLQGEASNTGQSDEISEVAGGNACVIRNIVCAVKSALVLTSDGWKVAE